MDDDLLVAVRSLTGTYDLVREDGRWVCSCGASADCWHAVLVEAWLRNDRS
jgi:hypothetical protein